MDIRKRKALEEAGWRIGDAADFLELTDAERCAVDTERQFVRFRVALGEAVRRARKARKLTQSQLAAMLKSTQPRVARIEAAAPEVSLDLMLRGFFAVGGRLDPAPKPDHEEPLAKAGQTRRPEGAAGSPRLAQRKVGLRKRGH